MINSNCFVRIEQQDWRWTCCNGWWWLCKMLKHSGGFHQSKIFHQ